MQRDSIDCLVIIALALFVALLATIITVLLAHIQDLKEKVDKHEV